MKEAPPDPILSTTTKFKEDTDTRKVNLGVGAYRTEQGKPYVLPVIFNAEQEMLEQLGKSLDKEYAPIDGPPGELKVLTQKLLFSDAAASIKENRVASAQALSGTGSLRVAGEYIKTHMAEPFHTIYVSDPTWGNHNAIFAKAGCKVKTYPYWHEATKGMDWNGMKSTLNSAPNGSTILLHAVAHNPTGIDPTQDQWREIVEICRTKKHFPMLDCAYQGYASGDLHYDGFALRLFETSGLQFMVCQSFAKNLGLYGERMGMLHVVCKSAAECKIVASQVKLVIRPMYSSPPIHGAYLLLKVLESPKRFAQWKQELKAMADRILSVRKKLRDGLESKGTPGTWNHITDQIGMFSYTGLTVPQCERLMSMHHIYLLKSGRISLAGLNNGNVLYVAGAIDEVIRNA